MPYAYHEDFDAEGNPHRKKWWEYLPFTLLILYAVFAFLYPHF